MEEKYKIIYPKSEGEYTKVWKWKISSRLLGVLGAIACVVSFIVVVNLRASVQRNVSSGTYNYDSVFLNFISGNVEIKAEEGYIAYKGRVHYGKVSGEGTLYGQKGNTIYSGEFEDNEYSGTGRLYGENEEILYEGEFKHNLYEGEGSEYGTGGTVIYQGMFSRGKRNGKGALFDDSSNPVYEGNFTNGEIVYKDFLGKTTEEASKIYMGKRDIYYDTEYFIGDMKDIGAMYSGRVSGTSLDDKVLIDKIFVKSESCNIGGKTASGIDEVKEIAGDIVYEGNVNISVEEAVVLSSLSGLEVNAVFDDAMEITGYDKDKLLYIYSFQLEKLQYTFYSQSSDGKFIMYSIEQLQDEGKGGNE